MFLVFFFKFIRESIYLISQFEQHQLCPTKLLNTPIDKLNAQLAEEFEMKDLGEGKKILGMEIKRDRKKGIICLTQNQYLKKVLDKFGINRKTKVVSTPLAHYFNLHVLMSQSTEKELKHMAQILYINVVCALMYTMVCTRPEISHVVSMVNRYMHDLQKGHWQAVNWILRYIHGTVDLGLKF